MTLGPRFDEAIVYAADAHRKEKRTGTNIPYIGHLLGVASIVVDYEGDEDETIAALLHDAPEDQGGQARLDDIRAKFGKRVAKIVEACSDSLTETTETKADWPERKKAYLQHLAGNPDASVFLVSAADKLHNLRSMLADYRVDEDNLWKRFDPKAGKVGSIRYYRSLLTAYIALDDRRVNRVALALRETLHDLEDACRADSHPDLANGLDLMQNPI